MTSAVIGVATTGSASLVGEGDGSVDRDGVTVVDEHAATRRAVPRIATRPRTLGDTSRS
jgi:hypothetical protein